MSSKKSFNKLRSANKLMNESNAKIAKPMSRTITPMVQNIEHTEQLKEQNESVFAQDSTFTLVKKIAIYRLMGNDFFLNHATTMVAMSYKLLGKTLTNAAINSTAGTVFTSGETTESLNSDIKEFNERNIGGVGNYVVEGLDTIDEHRIDQIQAYMEKSLEDITEEGQFGHFALKLSALLSIEAMTELSQAQDKFSEILLKSTDDVNKIKPELFLV